MSEAAGHPLVEAWADHLCESRRRSAHTVRAYQATAARLLDWIEDIEGCGADAARLGGLTAADLRAFLAARRAEGIGNASAARELSALRGFLRFVS